MPYSLRCCYSLVLDLFFIYSLFSAGESLSLVINVEVVFEIKPQHPISRGNMSVDQPFLIHCSRRSSYFSYFRWYAQSMLTSKGIVNSVMITFFELTDQMTRSGRWRVDVISVGKASCRSTSAKNVPVGATIKQCWFVPISMRSFRDVSFFNKLYFIHEIFTTHFYNLSNNP